MSTASDTMPSNLRPRRRILVIDDEVRMANSIKTLLSNCGFDVSVAYSGREGLEKLRSGEYDLAITDLRMNDLDGFEVMRALDQRPNIEFIVITAHASTESAIEAIHHKAFDYLTKPFDFDVLRASVERAFAKIDAERFRDDMISMITHDIKIPLSSIIGYSGMIYDRTTGELHPRAAEFVQTIHSNGLKILSLVDNFLTSCKIEAGKLTIVPRDVDINFIVEDLLVLFRPDIERKHLDSQVVLSPGMPPVCGDENLLYRAVSNALSNACKFAPERGRIALRTAPVAAADSPLKVDSALVEVSNTGPGIPAEELPHVFDKYRRGRSQAGIEGSGLGAYVMRCIVEAHHGCVQIESRPNDLTTARIFLPTSSMGSAKHENGDYS
ncbi:MAG: response regulator [Candidatus Sumerlaeaceae bacterium]|nr:response regulator [Candidatus Sumerlaeaceae bacterium]